MVFVIVALCVILVSQLAIFYIQAEPAIASAFGQYYAFGACRRHVQLCGERVRTAAEQRRRAQRQGVSPRHDRQTWFFPQPVKVAGRRNGAVGYAPLRRASLS